MAEEAGGFYARLALNTDEASFSRGIGKIGDVASGLKGLLVAGAGLAGLTLSFKALLDAASEQANLGQMALSLNMSASNLQNWSEAIRIAGADAGAFASSVGVLNQKMVDLRAFGEKPGDKFWIAVHGLGVDPNAMLTMTNGQRIAALMKGAENLSKTNPQFAQTYLREALGQSAVNLLTRSMQTGVSVSEFYQKGAAASFTGGSDMTGAAKGMTELRQSAETMKGAFNLFSDRVLTDLTPSLKDLNAWLVDNKESIASLVKSLADLTAAILTLTGIFLGIPLKDLATFQNTDAFKKNQQTIKDMNLGKTGSAVANATLNNPMMMWYYNSLTDILTKLGWKENPGVGLGFGTVKIDITPEARRLLQVTTPGMGGGQAAADHVFQAR